MWQRLVLQEQNSIFRGEFILLGAKMLVRGVFIFGSGDEKYNYEVKKVRLSGASF